MPGPFQLVKNVCIVLFGRLTTPIQSSISTGGLLTAEKEEGFAATRQNVSTAYDGQGVTTTTATQKALPPSLHDLENILGDDLE